MIPITLGISYKNTGSEVCGWWHRTCYDILNMAESDERIRASESQILEYFRRNPLTADTLEGVVRWRLREQQIFSTIEATKEAIERLVAQGQLLRIVLRGRDPLYCFNGQYEGQLKESVKNVNLPGEDLRVEVILKNSTRYLEIVTLNNGATIHLAPDEASGPVDDQEINGNAKVERLVGLGRLKLTLVEREH